MEAIWFLDTILPKTVPTDDELWWHKTGLFQTSMTLFSYIDAVTGLLARHYITLLVDPDRVKSSTMDLAFSLKKTIINHGGMSAVLSEPNVRFSSILVVIGPLKESWQHYLLPLHSSDLIKEALASEKFDFASISKYQLSRNKETHFCLNINYVSQLM